MAAEGAWEAVIGLETHVQLGTDSKIFTAASTTFGDDPNTHIDPVVCGLPGTLPVLNQKVLMLYRIQQPLQQVESVQELQMLLRHW